MILVFIKVILLYFLAIAIIKTYKVFFFLTLMQPQIHSPLYNVLKTFYIILRNLGFYIIFLFKRYSNLALADSVQQLRPFSILLFFQRSSLRDDQVSQARSI
jgi:hypothetical protein